MLTYDTLFGPKVDQALLVVNPNERLDAQGTPEVLRRKSLKGHLSKRKIVKLWGCNVILEE